MDPLLLRTREQTPKYGKKMSATTCQKKFKMQGSASNVVFLGFTWANIETLPHEQKASEQCSLF
jgi:hypothetical protein